MEDKSRMKNRISAWIVLGAITIVAALSLAVTNEVTKAPIAQQAALAEGRAKLLVMPGAETFDEITLEDGKVLFEAKAADGASLGFVGKTERGGYGGPVEVIAGVSPDGTVTGVNVGGSSFSETPGLGAKARDAAFTDQFKGKKSPLRLGDSTQDNMVDALTAATITSNAVVAGVNEIAKQVNGYLNPDAGNGGLPAAEGTSYAGEAEGFKGPVAVVVTVKDDGTISALKVGDDRFHETDGLGTLALEPEFAASFVGKALPVALSDIDALTGATVTTQAVVDAVNKAYVDKNIVIIGPALPEGTSYTGEAEGFKGPVAVVVTVKDDGTVTALKVGDDRFHETDGIGTLVLEPDFTASFVGKTLPVTLSDIDAIAGSTVTTQAVVDAVNKAYEDKIVVSTGPALPEGTPYAGEAEGFKGPVAVVVTVKDDGTVTALKVGDDRFHETDGIGTLVLEPDFTASFVGKTLPVTLSDIDAIAGSTVTTQAVVDAVNKAYEDKNAVGAAQPAQTSAPTAQPTAAVTEAPVEIPADAVTARMEGFAGPVAVTVAFDGEGHITFLKVGDADFKETDGLGTEALKPAFTGQFIGKLPPLNLRAADENAADTNVDGVSGATVTSRAVIDAVNEAHAQKFPQPAATEAPVLTGTTVTVTKEGFMGPVTVLTTFNADGTVQSVAINPMEFFETPGYGQLALEGAYTEQFAGKQPPLALAEKGAALSESTVPNLTGPDAVTSATRTAQAVVDAVNEAYAVFQSVPQEYTVTKQGFMGPVEVRVTFGEDGTVNDVKIGGEGFAETPGYGAAAMEEAFSARFAGKRPPLKIREANEAPGEHLVDNILNPDTVTSATATMQAILDAINEAYASRP